MLIVATWDRLTDIGHNDDERYPTLKKRGLIFMLSYSLIMPSLYVVVMVSPILLVIAVFFFDFLLIFNRLQCLLFLSTLSNTICMIVYPPSFGAFFNLLKSFLSIIHVIRSVELLYVYDLRAFS